MAETPLTDPVQPIGEPVGAAPGAGKDDALPGPVALEQQQEQVKLSLGRDRDVVLLDGFDRDLVLRQVDLDRLVHVPMGELPDIRVDRGRQQHRLAWRRQFAEDSLDIGPEPDVEHPIGLVEHHVNDIAQIKRTALDVVEHAARGADRQVDTPRESANLLFDRLAAEYAADPHGEPIASFWISATICCVSSRVGARTIACGPRARASSISISGIPKAAVFPVPVLAWPMTSRPSRASGIKAVWMGVGVR